MTESRRELKKVGRLWKLLGAEWLCAHDAKQEGGWYWIRDMSFWCRVGLHAHRGTYRIITPTKDGNTHIVIYKMCEWCSHKKTPPVYDSTMPGQTASGGWESVWAVDEFLRGK